ncbi:MAG: hypothetical protein R2789_05020 [Microthrixaceae bacterium]
MAILIVPEASVCTGSCSEPSTRSEASPSVDTVVERSSTALPWVSQPGPGISVGEASSELC